MKLAVVGTCRFALAACLVACATATPPSSDDEPGGADASPAPGPDGATAPVPDARPLPGPADAAPPSGLPDAAPPSGSADAAPTPATPDAAPPSGGICSSNAECPHPAECCYLILCVPGTEFGDLCFPS
jgi:hypothetical protein